MEERRSLANHFPLSALYETHLSGSSTYVYCDMESLGGGWTLLLKNSNKNNNWSMENIYSLNTDQPMNSLDHSKIGFLDNIMKHEFTAEYTDIMMIWNIQNNPSNKILISEATNGLWMRVRSSMFDLNAPKDASDAPLIIYNWGDISDGIIKKGDLRTPWIPSQNSDVLLTLRSEKDVRNSDLSFADLVLKVQRQNLGGKSTMVFARESLKGPSVELIYADNRPIWLKLNERRLFETTDDFCGIILIVINLENMQMEDNTKVLCGETGNKVEKFLRSMQLGDPKEPWNLQKALFVFWNDKPTTNSINSLKDFYPGLQTQKKLAFITHLSKKETLLPWERMESNDESNLYFSAYLKCIPQGNTWSPWTKWGACKDNKRKRSRRCCSFFLTASSDECKGNSVEEEKCEMRNDECPDEIVRGYSWDITQAGKIALLKCNRDRVGNAYRQCLSDGKWQAVVENECVRNSLVSLKIKADESKSKKDMIDVLGEFMTEVEQLETEGDMKTSVDVYSHLVGNSSMILTNETNQAKDDFMNKMVTVTDHILDPKNEPAIQKYEIKAQIILRAEELAVKRMVDSCNSNSTTNKTYEGKRYVIHVHHISSASSLKITGKHTAIKVDQASIQVLLDGNSAAGNTSVGIATTALAIKDRNYYASGSTFIGSDVVSVTFSTNLYRMRPNNVARGPVYVEIAFKDLEGVHRPTCVFLDDKTASKSWFPKGCVLISEGKGEVSCRCNHTTNYAVLMQVVNVEISEFDDRALMYITYIGITLSIISIVLMMCVYQYLRHVQSVRIQLHKCLVTTLLIAQILFMLNSHIKQHEIACMIVALVLHYLFTSLFCWMLAEGIHLLVLVLYPTARVEFPPLLFIGSVLPFIIVLISGSLNYEHYVSDFRCWLNVSNGIIFAFVGPALAIILVNTIVLVIILYVFLRVKRNADKCTTDKIRAGIRATIVLLPILGITWILGIFSINKETIVFSYISCILNSTQGISIFLLHVIFNEEVKSALKSKLHVNESRFNSLNKKKELSSLELWVDFMSKVTGFTPKKKKNKVAPFIINQNHNAKGVH